MSLSMSARLLRSVSKRTFSTYTSQSSKARMMESVEHSLLLKDGRTLAYHTFPATSETKQDDDDLHPVLYFHGYPGCGLEAGIACAPSVAKAGGRIYAIDRPGMGKISSPYGAIMANSKDEVKDKSNTDKNL